MNCDPPASGKYGGWSTVRCTCPRFEWCFPCMGSVWHGSEVAFYSFCQLHCSCEFGRGIDAVGSKNELLVNVEAEQRGVSGSSLQRQSDQEANSPVSSIYSSEPESPDQDEKNIQSQFLAPPEEFHWESKTTCIDSELSTQEKSIYKTLPFPGITVWQIPKRIEKFTQGSTTADQESKEPELPHLRASLYAYEIPVKFSR